MAGGFDVGVLDIEWGRIGTWFEMGGRGEGGGYGGEEDGALGGFEGLVWCLGEGRCWGLGTQRGRGRGLRMLWAMR